jgi:hypothetical protein
LKSRSLFGKKGAHSEHFYRAPSGIPRAFELPDAFAFKTPGLAREPRVEMLGTALTVYLFVLLGAQRQLASLTGGRYVSGIKTDGKTPDPGYTVQQSSRS